VIDVVLFPFPVLGDNGLLIFALKNLLQLLLKFLVSDMNALISGDTCFLQSVVKPFVEEGEEAVVFKFHVCCDASSQVSISAS